MTAPRSKSLAELWHEAGEDPERYRALMREHGMMANGAGTRTAIPYLADQENLRRSRTAGQRYASAPRPRKSAARNAILSDLTRARHPATLSILTMPGMAWSFERSLLAQREPASVLRDGGVHADAAGRVAGKTKRTVITAVEREPAIYAAALRAIPGASCGIAHVNAPWFANRALQTPLVRRFYLSSAEQVLQHAECYWHAAWLDFTGPLTPARCEVIGRAWAEGRVRDLLTVTTTPARTSQPLKREIDAAGGIPGYLRLICVGSVIAAAVPYRDTMPMIQVTLARDGAQ
jgi:hypothetical protein